MSISLHNGGTEIGWPWGSNNYLKNSNTRDEKIYHQIGEALKREAGSNNFMKEFKIGTMNRVVYSVSGGFEDWAYAASWEPSKIHCSPPGISMKKYPPQMMNGLVFLFELGEHSIHQQLYGS